MYVRSEIDCRAFSLKANPHPPGTVRHFMHGTPREQWWFWYHHKRVERRDGVRYALARGEFARLEGVRFITKE